MNLRSIFASLAVVAALFPASAHAVVNWGWHFTTPNLGTVNAGDSFVVKAEIYNDISSTEVLDLGSDFRAISSGSLLRNGVADCCNYAFGMGDGGPNSFNRLLNDIFSTVLAPGQSRSIDFEWFVPAAGSAAPGNYSHTRSLGVCPGNGCWDYPMVSATLTWQVAATVPEPTSAAMLALGLLGVGLGARRLQAQRR